MTTGFHQLALDDTVQLKGPLGSFIWNGQGLANWKGSDRKVKEVGMICGGSGGYWKEILGLLSDELEQGSRPFCKSSGASSLMPWTPKPRHG